MNLSNSQLDVGLDLNYDLKAIKIVILKTAKNYIYLR